MTPLPVGVALFVFGALCWLAWLHASARKRAIETRPGWYETDSPDYPKWRRWVAVHVWSWALGLAFTFGGFTTLLEHALVALGLISRVP